MIGGCVRLFFFFFALRENITFNAIRPTAGKMCGNITNSGLQIYSLNFSRTRITMFSFGMKVCASRKANVKRLLKPAKNSI